MLNQYRGVTLREHACLSVRPILLILPSSPIVPPSTSDVGGLLGPWCRSVLDYLDGSFWRERRKLSENGYIDIVGNIAETA